MSKKEIKEFLLKKPGYLKKSAFDIELAMIRAGYNPKNNLLKITELIRSTRKEVSNYLKKEIIVYRASNEAVEGFKKSKTSTLKQSKNSKNGKVKETKDRNKTRQGKDVSKISLKGHKDSGLHIILPDVHSPFDNKIVIQGIISFIKDLGSKLKGFHLLGDFLEMNSVSSHSKGDIPLKGITLGYEYQKGNKLLDQFEKALPKDISKNYLYGNHEARYFSITKKSDTNKFADAILGPTKGLRLKERGYKVYEDWRNDYIKLGNHLHIIHGEFCTNNPAKTHLQKYKTSCIFGHTHRADAYYEGDMAAFNIGALADFNAPCFDYVSRITKLNWKNGFALVQIDEQGFFHAQVITAYNNHFWVNGKKY